MSIPLSKSAHRSYIRLLQLLSPPGLCPLCLPAVYRRGASGLRTRRHDSGHKAGIFTGNELYPCRHHYPGLGRFGRLSPFSRLVPHGGIEGCHSFYWMKALKSTQGRHELRPAGYGLRVLKFRISNFKFLQASAAFFFPAYGGLAAGQQSADVVLVAQEDQCSHQHGTAAQNRRAQTKEKK